MTLMISRAEATVDRTVEDYVMAVFGRARRPMVPAEYVVDWDDAPGKFKTYPQVPTLSAPPLPTGPLGNLTDLLAQPDVGGEWTAREISALAGLGYGVRERRLAANWNQDLHSRLHYPGAVWGRATASGGGMYPLEIYWVTGSNGSVRAGVYHYHAGAHAWQRLATGDQSAAVREACLDDPGAVGADEFLVVCVRFWRNAFKYHDFCYHVVTQDLGALLGSWHLIARGLGTAIRPVLWFADDPINSLLGLDTDQEVALAIVPLSRRGATGMEPASAPHATSAPHAPAVTCRAVERSRTVLRFPRVINTHRATVIDRQPRPGPLGTGFADSGIGFADSGTGFVDSGTGFAHSGPGARLGAAAADAGELIVLPLDLPTGDLAEALSRRRSSFGAFSRADRLTVGQLGGVLTAAAAARQLPGDTRGDIAGQGGAAGQGSIGQGSIGQGGMTSQGNIAGEAGMSRLFVVVNDVDGLPAGSFVHDADRRALRPVRVGDVSGPLQQAYFLTNYNLEQVAAVVAITGRFAEGHVHYGPRGYRLLNAEVGAVAQVAYLAATSLGIGCGAVLGLDSEVLDDIIGITGTGEHSMLFLLLGRERAHRGLLVQPIHDTVPAKSHTHGQTKPQAAEHTNGRRL